MAWHQTSDRPLPERVVMLYTDAYKHLGVLDYYEISVLVNP